jgi:hypothetical protein
MLHISQSSSAKRPGSKNGGTALSVGPRLTAKSSNTKATTGCPTQDSTPGPSRVSVVTVVKSQRGGSQSRLVLCDDGKLYVLKMFPNPQGPDVLANEALGAILLRGLGFLVPRWRPVTIEPNTLTAFPELTLATTEGMVPPACGVQFGSEYLGGSGVDLYDLLPESRRDRVINAKQFVDIHLFDLWANHQDQRQCVYRRVKKTHDYEAFFIDNGHLFGGPDWSTVSRQPPRAFHYAGSSIFRGPDVNKCLTLYSSRIPALLCEAISQIPPEWYKNDIVALYARLRQRLEDLKAIVHQLSTM